MTAVRGTVMTTRKGKIVNIDEVARGRIFLAADAKNLGMVDELGGLDEAPLVGGNAVAEGGHLFRKRPPGLVHQCEVTLMQVSHGRHEADAAALATPGAHPALEVGDGREVDH